MKSIFLTEDIHQCRAVYDETARAQLRGTMTDETVFRKADVLEAPERFADTETVFSTWGMPTFATFLNTGRGAQVVEPELVRALAEREDLTAVLDVTDPEPLEPGHPFYTLPNCILTPHIAGSLGREVTRMAACMIQEFERVSAGHPARFEVTPEMLETMA